MKRFLLLSILVAFTAILAGEGGTLPSKEGQSPRYQIVAGQIQYDANGSPQPTFIRLDTWTGATWFMNNTPLHTGVAGVVPLVQFWQPLPEQDSPRIESIISSIPRASK